MKSAIAAILLLTLPLCLVFGYSVPDLLVVMRAGVKEAELRAALVSHLSLYMIGVLIGGIGVLVLGFSIDAVGYRPSWVYWVMIVLGVAWVLYFPAGTMVGIVLIAYSTLKRKSFGVE